ncbi:MAG: helix-turn-helix domain-containing protein [Burkholderiales bacterium]
MVDAYASGHFSMQDIATHLGIHYSTVSRAIKKLGSRGVWSIKQSTATAAERPASGICPCL